MHMTGWRIGYSAGPPEIIEAMSKIQSQCTTNPTSIAQKASIEALMNSQDSVKIMVEEFDRRRKYMTQRLNSIEGISCLKPMGAFYTFPRASDLYERRFKGKKIKTPTVLLIFCSKIQVLP